MRGKFQLFLIFFLKRVELVHGTGVRDLEVVFFRLILADLMTYVAKIYQIGLYK